MRYLGLIVVWVWTCSGFAGDDWTKRSDENARVLLDIMAKYSPESAGQIGIEGLDEMIVDLKPGVNERLKADVLKAISALEKKYKNEEHPALRQDLEILIDAGKQAIRGQELSEKYEYGFNQLSQSVFFGIRGLLDDQVSADRRPAALTRLRKYAGLEGGEPITLLARDRMNEQFEKKGLLWPNKTDLEHYLRDSPRYMAALPQLFDKYGIKGYEAAYEKLQKQMEDYHDYLKKEVLPNARTDFRQPEELYAYALEQIGITIPPQELIFRAQTAFTEIQNEMNALAPLLARDLGLKSTDYRDVIRHLKKSQFEGEAILPHYQKRIKELEKLIEENQIITLPERDMRIRLASEAESAATPAPHMQPPRMIGNTGEIGQFVLPLKIPGADGEQSFDDFTFEAASWTLTVHEGRPGHELQFAAMVEKGVSLARSLFAFNSVNVEGWALYSEAVMKQHMPLDGQLISLQHRLLRAARAFLDPKLQLGLIDPESAKAFLIENVVLSEAMANQEVERYTIRSPGQATAYFFGYSNLMSLRAEVELLLGDKLVLKDFHDFVLGQGMLPPHLLRKAVLDEFVKGVMEKKS